MKSSHGRVPKAAIEKDRLLPYSGLTILRCFEDTMPSQKLESYLSGRWSSGDGIETHLVDPVSGEELATASAKGLDLAGALSFARREGQETLRAMSYGAR